MRDRITAITTSAPFLEMSVGDAKIGDTVVVSGGRADVRVRVRSPRWAPVDRLRVYTNGGALVADQAIPPGQGTSYETIVSVELPRDGWVVAEVTGSANMFPVVTPTEFPPLDATVLITALSSGLDLSSLPIASNLKPEPTHPTTPYAITNPIWIDTDGDGWDPPGPPLPRPSARPARRPDVREQFEAIPDLGAGAAR